MGQCPGMSRSRDTGARESACVLWGEAVPLSSNWEERKRALRDFFAARRQGVGGIGVGMGHVGGLPCSGRHIPKGPWAVAQEMMRQQGGRWEPGVAWGALGLPMCPFAVGVLFVFLKDPQRVVSIGLGVALGSWGMMEA